MASVCRASVLQIVHQDARSAGNLRTFLQGFKTLFLGMFFKVEAIDLGSR